MALLALPSATQLVATLGTVKAKVLHLATYYLLLTTHYSLLTADYSLLTMTCAGKETYYYC